jgi:hypothetical protein
VANFVKNFLSRKVGTLFKKTTMTQEQNTRMTENSVTHVEWEAQSILMTDFSERYRYICGWRNFPSLLCCAPASCLAFVTVYNIYIGQDSNPNPNILKSQIRIQTKIVRTFTKIIQLRNIYKTNILFYTVL